MGIETEVEVQFRVLPEKLPGVHHGRAAVCRCEFVFHVGSPKLRTVAKSSYPNGETETLATVSRSVHRLLNFKADKGGNV